MEKVISKRNEEGGYTVFKGSVARYMIERFFADQSEWLLHELNANGTIVHTVDVYPSKAMALEVAKDILN